MLWGMTTDQVAAAAVTAETLTDAQLHGKACINCGATSGLVPAGHVYTKTRPGKAPLGWAVTACPTHVSEVTR